MNDKDKPSKAERTRPMKKLTVEDLAQVIGSGVDFEDPLYEKKEDSRKYPQAVDTGEA